MIFGGLEIVAGGYLIYRHYRKKNEKERLEDEAHQRRHNTFPGANSQKSSCWNTQAQHRPQYHHPNQQPHPYPYPQQQQQQQPVPVVPEQKYAYYSPTSPTNLPPYGYPCPQRPTHTQSFNIPRRPLQAPAIIIQPSLQRADSCATISRMHVADGSRPSNMPEHESRPPPNAQGGLRPAPLQTVYGNAGFSMSTPALGATPTSPAMTYVMATEQDVGGRHTIDDNWETYAHNQPHYAPTVSTNLGERDDPPPPYRP